MGQLFTIEILERRRGGSGSIPLASTRTPEHSLLTSLVIGVSPQPFRTDIQPPPSFEVSWRHRIFGSSNPLVIMINSSRSTD
jgi:hypothetical protein